MLPRMKAWKILWGATGLALAATGFSAEALRLTAYERAQGWRLLFDGKSLSDWRGYRESKVPANWKVVDGHLAGSGGTPLIAEEDYQDFELTFEWKVSEGGVGEVYFHVNEDGKNPEETGPVMQLAGHNGPIGGNGGLTSYWHEVSVQWDTWYQAKIMVFGYQVEYWINGEKVMTYLIDTKEWRAAVAASRYKVFRDYALLRQGRVVLAGSGVTFRAIKVRPL